MERKHFFHRYSRVIHRLGLGSIAFGIFAALAKAWATYLFGPENIIREETALVQLTPVEVRPTTIDDLLRTSPISLADWQSKVEEFGKTPAQRERQFREFLGREVIWEGFVDQINPIPDGVKEGPGSILMMHESYAALHSQAVLSAPRVRCWCPPETARKIEKLSRGEWIVVRGELKNPIMLGTALGTDLSNCQLITSNKERSPQIALESESNSVLR